MLHACCRFKYVNRMKNGTYRALIAEGKGRALYIGHFKTEEEAPELLMSQDCFWYDLHVPGTFEPTVVTMLTAQAFEHILKSLKWQQASTWKLYRTELHNDVLCAAVCMRPQSNCVHWSRLRAYMALLVSYCSVAPTQVLNSCGKLACTAVCMIVQNAQCSLVQNQEPVNYGADEYDSAHIRASASSLDELVASMRPVPKRSTR